MCPCFLEIGIKLVSDKTQRWVLSQIFMPFAQTKNLTLQEMRNGQDHNIKGYCDATDEDVAREILRRANLAETPRYEEFVELFADALSGVDEPRNWINPTAVSEPKDETKSEVKEKEQGEDSSSSVPISDQKKSTQTATQTSKTPEVKK